MMVDRPLKLKANVDPLNRRSVAVNILMIEQSGLAMVGRRLLRTAEF